MADGTLGAYNTVSVGTSATLIRAAASARDAIIVQNAHASNLLYIGTDSSVTTSNGLRVGAGESISVPTRGNVYGIASGASTDVRYLEVS